MSATKHREPVIAGESVSEGLGNAVDMMVLSGLQGAQAEGEPDLVVQLIDLYLEDAPRRLAAISALLAQRDALSLRQAAHGLKGSSATLGAGRTAQLCEAVEQMALDNSLEAGAELVKELHEELARVRQAFLLERQKRTGTSSELLAENAIEPSSQE